MFASILFAAVIPMLIIMYVTFVMISDNMKHSRFEEIKTNASMIINTVNTSGYIKNQVGNTTNDDIDSMADMYSGRIRIVDKNLVIIKDTYGKEYGRICTSKDVIECLSEKKERVLNYKSQKLKELIMPILDADDEIAGVLIVGYSENDINKVIVNVHKKIILICITIIMLIGIFAIFISYLISASVNKIDKSVKLISEGDFYDDIRVNDFSETAKLSDSLNSMYSSIRNLEKNREEFVSNVSHELKTPITSIKILADSLIGQENVPVELYQEFMTDIATEIERENKIITDLLSLVKMDKTVAKLNIEQVNVNNVLEALLKRLRPIANERNIEVVMESFREVTAEIDETKLSLALSNLVENAIKYNYEDGWVRVSLNADHKFFYVRISDSGVGIPLDCIDHIFERFYRVDKARSRQTGGTGLGLSITRNVILMHKGSIKVHSKENEGTTFTVRIPLNYITSSK